VAGLAIGAFKYASLWPTSQIFGRTLIAGDDPTEIALTFDDGPNEIATPMLLELLARHNVAQPSSASAASPASSPSSSARSLPPAISSATTP
jgi:hypothetical protein